MSIILNWDQNFCLKTASSTIWGHPMAQNTGVKDRRNTQLGPLRRVVIKSIESSPKWNHIHYRSMDLSDINIKFLIDFFHFFTPFCVIPWSKLHIMVRVYCRMHFVCDKSSLKNSLIGMSKVQLWCFDPGLFTWLLCSFSAPKSLCGISFLKWFFFLSSFFFPVYSRFSTPSFIRFPHILLYFKHTIQTSLFEKCIFSYLGNIPLKTVLWY